MTRQALDLPVINRATVGFDRFLNELEQLHTATPSGYPPYNIIRETENDFVIELAVAGFKRDEISVELVHSQLVVKGESVESNEGQLGEYVHRGLAMRNFEKKFSIADYIEVKEATLADGILRIRLERIVPESMKPRQIEIQ